MQKTVLKNNQTTHMLVKKGELLWPKRLLPYLIDLKLPIPQA